MTKATIYRAEIGRVYDGKGHDVTAQLADVLWGFSGGHLELSPSAARRLADDAAEVQRG
jgi:hypothetical protein